MAPHTIKLTYFNGRGLAEVPRLILAAADAPYDNVRLTHEEWPKHKADTPLGQLPVLEFDGVSLAQSATIARFLARKFNLAGADDVEQAQADMIVDLVIDTRQALRKVMLAPTDDDKKEAAKKFLAEDFPAFLTTAEKILKQRGGKHFAGSKLTWADIVVFDFVTNLTNPDSPVIKKRMQHLDDPARLTVLEEKPLLSALVEDVLANPGIAKWLNERPSDAEEAF